MQGIQENFLKQINHFWANWCKYQLDRECRGYRVQFPTLVTLFLNRNFS